MSKHNPATCGDPVNCPECSVFTLDIMLIPKDRSKPMILPGFSVAVNIYNGQTKSWEIEFIRRDVFQEIERTRNRANYN